MKLFLYLWSLMAVLPQNGEKSFEQVYVDLHTLGTKPDFACFELAMKGHAKLVDQQRLSRSHIITIIDFNKSSAQNRLWVIDLKQEKVVFETLVAHGKNTGELYAKSFSNRKGSNKSSLGFYRAAEIYYGKHGYSLNLDGLEPGINDNARERRIVMHGADYVSNEFVKKHGRLGRSFGCPAVPIDEHRQIIDYIKDGSCLFIYCKDDGYVNQSQLLGEGAR